MTRRAAYIIAFLVALLVSIVPAAMLPDLIVPIRDSTDVRSPLLRKNEVDRFPKYIQREMLAFKWLTYPPSLAGEAVGHSRTEYARLVAPDGIATEAWPVTPPTDFALEHLYRALPFWLACIVLIGESLALLRKKVRARFRMRMA